MSIAPRPAYAVALMLLGCVFFSVMALCVAVAHRLDPGLHTAVTTLFRSAVNLLLLAVLARGRLRLLWGDGGPSLWLRGLAGAVSLGSYFASLVHLTMGEAAFLNQTSALWVAMMAPLVLGERTSRVTWVAVAGSLFGLALLMGPPASDLHGRLLGLLSGLAAAVAYLAVRSASVTNPPLAIVAWFGGVATLGSLAWTLAVGAEAPRDTEVLALLVGSGVAATAGQLLMTRAYQLGPAAPVAAAGAAGPLLGTLLGALLLAQVPHGQALAGMGVLFVSAVVLPFVGGRR